MLKSLLTSESQDPDMHVGVTVVKTGHEVSYSTTKNTKWGVRRFREWASVYNDEITCPDLATIEPAQLNILLKTFWENVTGKDDQDLNPSTLISIRAALSRHLHDLKRNIDIIRDVDFVSSNAAFTARCKQYYIRVGHEKLKQKRPIGRTDLATLAAYFRDLSTPKRLQQYVWFNICYFFGSKAREEFRAMTKNTFIVCRDDQGLKYVACCKMEEKQPHKGESSSQDQAYPLLRMYSTGGAMDPVEAFETYVSRLSAGCDSLWQVPKIRQHELVAARPWYKMESIGKNVLSAMMTRLSEDAGLDEIYTTQCVHATAIATLYKNGIETDTIRSMSQLKNESSAERIVESSAEDLGRECSRILSASLAGTEKGIRDPHTSSGSLSQASADHLPDQLNNAALALGHVSNYQSFLQENDHSMSEDDFPEEAFDNDSFIEEDPQNDGVSSSFIEWLHVQGFTESTVHTLLDSGFKTKESLNLLDEESFKELGISLQQRLLLKSTIQKTVSQYKSYNKLPSSGNDVVSTRTTEEMEVVSSTLQGTNGVVTTGEIVSLNTDPGPYKQHALQVFQTLLKMIPDSREGCTSKSQESTVDLMHSMRRWKALKDQLALHGPDSDAALAEKLLDCWRENHADVGKEGQAPVELPHSQHFTSGTGLKSQENGTKCISPENPDFEPQSSSNVDEQARVTSLNKGTDKQKDDLGRCVSKAEVGNSMDQEPSTLVKGQGDLCNIIIKPDPDGDQIVINHQLIRMPFPNLQTCDSMVSATNSNSVKTDGTSCLKEDTNAQGDGKDKKFRVDVVQGASDPQPVFLIKNVHSLATSTPGSIAEKSTEKSKVTIKNSCKCRYCVQVFSGEEDCQIHERTLCDKNPERMKSDRKAGQNITRSNEKLLSCRYCFKQFRDQAILKSHEKIHTTSCKTYRCQYCPKTFTTKTSCILHELIHPEAPRKYYACRFCQKKFVNRLSCRKHERHHSPATVHLCQYCNKSFHKKEAYLRHERTHTEEHPYKCTFCDERFAKKFLCTRHESIHKSFQCKFCSRTFPTVYTYSAHMKKHKVSKQHHQSENPVSIQSEQSPSMDQESMIFTHNHLDEHFKCQFCGFIFYSKEKHELHELVVHRGKEPFKCQFCDKMFAQRESYLEHEIIHTGVQPYKCRFCARAFGDEQDCILHERIHRVDKPFKCKYCGKSFVVEELCTRHEATHLASKHYKCRYCNLLFTGKQFCLSHERSHTGLNRVVHTCLYCDKTFSDKKACRAHQRTHETW
ncbi:uncharacterized protein LOC106164839 [Lingula anatina]|uniref:Uncharacterized protein LOC106164839 n=1 Tax=Lingula anatina TaxID=7574 RepID=A0A1S3IJD8_LINAN|nr:uncharacterized protein LOC106164839 [Lingula anatina]|eukprot:XP_013398327.1 uncharacterized protein LOC106164839 [Lingula anatina]